MKTLLVSLLAIITLVVAAILFISIVSPAKAIDGRTITVGTTNVLAVGIDSQDFDEIWFYLRGNRTLKLRVDDLLHAERPVIRPPLAPNRLLERSNILESLRGLNSAGDFTAVNAPMIVSNLVRIFQIDERLR